MPLCIWDKWTPVGGSVTSPSFSSVPKTKYEYSSLPRRKITAHFPSFMLICSVTQSCLTLCDSMDHSPLGFSIHGISQARILERVAISSFRRSYQPRDRTHISCIGRQIFFFFLTTEPPGKPKVKGLVAQSCPHGHELYSLMDYSLSNSSVHGILQARILEYIAIPFSRESS